MNKKALEAVALSVRTLSIDAVQAANSGHPGMPMGCAELGALLYGEVLKHNPEVPDWIDRDRFVLSAGHGSMFLYSLLHLAGYNVSIEELKKFRQVGSPTAGHPEYGMLEGIETTTGPLGQGVANSVGMALAERMLAERFNTAEHTVIDHYTYSIAGDGCMMEGVSSEAASLAGHLGLGKLVVFYDSNSISIEGSTGLAFTEDTAKRFESYNWQVIEADGYDLDALSAAVDKAKAETEKPTLVVMKTVIGKGSPNKAGSHEVHGAALGEDEVKATKKVLGVDENAMFYIHPDAPAYFSGRKKNFQSAYESWKETFQAWAAANPEKKKEWDAYFGTPDLDSVDFPAYSVGDSMATRKASGAALNAIAEVMPNLVGGSADLAPSNNSSIKGGGDVNTGSFAGRVLHFGVREHAMGSVLNGMILHGGLRPFGATFLVFSDYMRPAMRLAALMKQPVIYILTHDSIFLGEDGPTHQPVEHEAALRCIPNMTVLRPADGEETNEAWKMAIEKTDGPTCLVLTRQGLPVLEKPAGWQKEVSKGAYIVKDSEGKPDVVVVATGSEVSMALEAAKQSKKNVRVVSLLSRETFLCQEESYRKALLPDGVRVVSAEAGVTFGWEGIASGPNDMFGINRFGESGPGKKVAEHLGFTAEKLAGLIDG